MQSNVLTAVALSLPLSSLWAASTMEGDARDTPAFANRKVFGNGATLPGSSPSLAKHQHTPTSTISRSTGSHLASPAPQYTRFAGPNGDIELQGSEL